MNRPLDRLTIAVAQLNPTVGDVAGNAEKARWAVQAAAGADLVIFPELFIAGYPPEDLVLKPAFQEACRLAVQGLARETSAGPALLIGTPWVEDGKLYNAVALLDGGQVAGLRFKVDLPNYGVFDEKRVFAPGPMPGPVNFRGVRIGIPICEDIWGPEPVVQHGHAMGQRHGLDLVVGDVDRGDGELMLHMLELGAHMAAQLGIEIGQRLVHQEGGRTAHDGPGQRHALALAAGELARKALQQGIELNLGRVSRTCLSISARGSFRITSG